MNVTISNIKKTKLTLADISHRTGTPFVPCVSINNRSEDVDIYIVLELWTNQRVKVLDIKGMECAYLPSETEIKEVNIDSMQVSLKYPLEGAL